MTCVILIPVYDDWVPLTRLIQELDAELAATATQPRVLVVDDGSPATPLEELRAANLSAIRDVSILRLRRNLGHQRAIAIGLCYLEANISCDFVVVMDGDGEDRPRDVLRLLAAARASDAPQVVFAERTRRSEGSLFFAMYVLYRALHFVLTGVRVRVGNFSVIPRPLLSRLVSVSDLWNHYAAAVFKSRVQYTMLPTTRGLRYAGRSSMDFVALVTHGLSAMAAFGDRIGVRLLAATVCLAAVLTSLVVAAAVLRIAGLIAIPSWAPLGVAMVILVLSQAFAVSLAFVFIILAGRDSSTFLPLRDFSYYILDLQQAFTQQDERLPLRR